MRSNGMRSNVRCTPSEKKIAQNIEQLAETLSGDFYARYSAAAIIAGYKDYDSLPRGTRRYILTPTDEEVAKLNKQKIATRMKGKTVEKKKRRIYGTQKFTQMVHVEI